MTPSDILAHPAQILTHAQRTAYFTNGFVAAEGLIPETWLASLTACSDRLVDASRAIDRSDETYDIGPSRSATAPHVRRIKALVDRDPIFWEFASQSPLVDIAADLVGPDVRFHSAKLNFKSPGAGEIVRWHQDIPAWPHTNYSPVTLGIHLGDVSTEQGPLVCIPGSHDGPLFVHRDDDGQWTGSIRRDDLATVGLDSGVALPGPAGTVVAINCRTVHGSLANATDRVRPIALFVYSSADALACTPAPSPTSRTGEIVRGRMPHFAHMDPRPFPIPPDWQKTGYGSIYTAQQPGD